MAPSQAVSVVGFLVHHTIHMRFYPETTRMKVKNFTQKMRKKMQMLHKIQMLRK